MRFTLGLSAAGPEAEERGEFSESVMVTGSGALAVVDEEVEGMESEGGEGSARAPAGRQSTARGTELKKLWRSEGAVGPTQVFPIAPARG
jgi:hypothetical protein